MDILGYNIPIGWDSTFMIALMALAGVMLFGLYIYISTNNSYPQKRFLIRDGGVWRWKTYRIKGGKEVIPDDILGILFGKSWVFGLDIAEYRSEQMVNNKGKTEKFYVAKLEKNLLVPEAWDISTVDSVNGRTIAEKFVQIKKRTQMLADQQDPLKSEIIKIIPMAALFFVAAIFLYSALQANGEISKKTGELQASVADMTLKSTDNLKQVAYRLKFDSTVIQPQGYNASTAGGG